LARHELWIDAPPEAVFDVLSDPASYAQWVVGSREVRNADEEWPRPGARFGHTVGMPPFTIKDDTKVLGCDPPQRLELLVRARPLPDAHVEMRLDPERGGTRVTMIEDLAHPLLNRLAGPIVHFAISVRNRESLRRLKLLAEGPAPR
jgi:uncharacterized protein YndB with AHSA1/START domain